jgi:hypothetical protein
MQVVYRQATRPYRKRDSKRSFHGSGGGYARGRKSARSRGVSDGGPVKPMTTTGKNRIMIYGPKTDGTYVVEFRTAEGESLAISIPRTETLRGKPSQPLTLPLKRAQPPDFLVKWRSHPARTIHAAFAPENAGTRFRGKRTRKLHLVVAGWDDAKVVQPDGCGQARRGWRPRPPLKTRTPSGPPGFSSYGCRSRASNRAFFALVF